MALIGYIGCSATGRLSNVQILPSQQRLGVVGFCRRAGLIRLVDGYRNRSVPARAHLSQLEQPNRSHNCHHGHQHCGCVLKSSIRRHGPDAHYAYGAVGVVVGQCSASVNHIRCMVVGCRCTKVLEPPADHDTNRISMRKLIILAPIIVLIILPFIASKAASPNAGLRKTIYGIIIFLIVWALLGPRIYFMLPDD